MSLPKPLGTQPQKAKGPPPAESSPLKLEVRKAKPIAPRIVLYAPEKFGKTTVASQAPNPVLLMAKGETGYDTLLSAGLVSPIPAIDIDSLETLYSTLDSLIVDPQGRETVILDALGGFDVLAQEVVCKRDFGGNWNDPRDGFLAYGADKGYKATANEWRKVLSRLDRLNQMGITIILLGHAKVQSFKNPLGADYDTYACDFNKHSWAETARWSDCILFGKFQTIVDKVTKGKGKAIGGATRVIYAEGRDAFTAGNRYGMPAEFELPEDREQAWSTLWGHIVKAPA